jgi:hypothetical protein
MLFLCDVLAISRRVFCSLIIAFLDEDRRGSILQLDAIKLDAFH